MTRPILYSFRRCPYAMRARLAISSAGVECALREIVLRDKAPAFLAASPKGTVPVLITPEGGVIEESLDIMHWALSRHDPEGWLLGPGDAVASLIATMDGPFKAALDGYKYSQNPADAEQHRRKAEPILYDLNDRLGDAAWLFGPDPRLADMASLPFVRQFANVDKVWFDAQPWPKLSGWLDAFLQSPRFARIMGKYPKWAAGDAQTLFPPPATDV